MAVYGTTGCKPDYLFRDDKVFLGLNYDLDEIILPTKLITPERTNSQNCDCVFVLVEEQCCTVH